MDLSCHSQTPNLLLTPLRGRGSLWALTNGPPPAGGTPTGGKAPAPAARVCPALRPTPPARPCDLRGANPERGRGRTAPPRPSRPSRGRFRGWEQSRGRAACARRVVWGLPLPLAAPRLPRAEKGEPHPGAPRCPPVSRESRAGGETMPGEKGGREAAVGRDHAVSGGGALRGGGGGRLDRTTPRVPRGGPARVNHCEPAGHGDTPGLGRVGTASGSPRCSRRVTS